MIRLVVMILAAILALAGAEFTRRRSSGGAHRAYSHGLGAPPAIIRHTPRHALVPASGALFSRCGR